MTPGGHPMRARADKAIDEMRRLYDDAESKIGFRLTATQKSVGAAFDSLAPQIEKWRSTYLRWAEVGARDDGSPYSWDRWFEHGGTLAASIAAHTRYSYEAGVFKAIADAAKQTADDLTNPLKWPAWAKLAGIGAIALLAFMVGVPVVRRIF